MPGDTTPPRLTAAILGGEPFRLFFPAAVLAGLAGTLLWPLHYAGVVEWYPGLNHARIMTHGFFGGCIIGFLGTALPRLLGARPLAFWEVVLLLGLHLAVVAAHATASNRAGDLLFLALLVALVVSLGRRFLARTDLPPPGFVLVLLAFGCAATGVLLWLLDDRLEDAFFWLNLRPLLAYHAFVLLPIVGVGGFILPRFFNLPNKFAFPESRTPPPGWMRETSLALAAGLVLIATFALEAAGWRSAAQVTRGLVATAYLFYAVPFWRSGVRGASAAWVLRLAFGLLPAGFLAAAAFPTHRVALLHLTLVGGFGLVTLAVATRVLFGHSGMRTALDGRLRWFTVMAVLMLLGLATRVSGDYWPKIQATHYSYGALLWAAGLLLWAVRALPRARVPDPED